MISDYHNFRTSVVMDKQERSQRRVLRKRKTVLEAMHKIESDSIDILENN